jgi:hypothetical protein
MNFTQVAMNTGHFIIIENYVTKSTQENLCYAAIAAVVRREKESKVIR